MWNWRIKFVPSIDLVQNDGWWEGVDGSHTAAYLYPSICSIHNKICCPGKMFVETAYHNAFA